MLPKSAIEKVKVAAHDLVFRLEQKIAIAGP